MASFHVVTIMVDILEQDQHHLDLDCKPQIDQFLEIARSVRDICLLTPHIRFLISDDFGIEMARAAHKAEDAIEVYVRNQLLPRTDEEMVSTLDLMDLMEDGESIRLNIPIDVWVQMANGSDALEVNGTNQVPPGEIVSTFNFTDLMEQFDYIRIPSDLLNQMAKSAHASEDGIGVYVTKQVRPGTTLDLKDLMEQFESFRVKLLQIADDFQNIELQVSVDTLFSHEQFQGLPTVDQRTKLDVPGIFEDDFQTLKVRLIQGPSKLQIINIDGPMGMGKRTLARRLYNDPEVAAHFRTRAWVACPFEGNEKSCLLNLLEGLGKLTSDMRRETVNQLKAHVRNALQDIKYFIVILDVIGEYRWVTLTSLFRNYGVGARVLYTTYNTNHEILLKYGGHIHPMRFMNDGESWLLFCQKVFGFESCPIELARLVMQIVGLCKGIPLAVTLVAGILTTNKETTEIWEHVVGRLSDTLKGLADKTIISYIFKVIYLYLPNYLRPCLLYVGAFDDSRDIKASTIIKLWIAEGFVKQSGGTSSEEYLAEMYLQILVDANLLSITQQEPNGRVKAFQVRPFLRINYWITAADEKFLGSTYYCYKMNRGDEKDMRRLSIDVSFTPLRGTELPVLARSFLALSGASERQDYKYLKLRFLRVLAVFLLEFYQFPIQIMQLVLLRYLAISCHSNLPTSFSKFRNLQTLIIRRLPTFRAFSLPSDLWELTQLINVKCKETFIWYYPRDGKRVVHEKLQTLSNVQLFGIDNEFLREVPNIKQLGIFCNIAMQTVFDLACLDKLERLKCSTDWSLASRNFLSYLTLPLSLRKLTLSLCRIPSELMEVIGSLPILEHLKLQKSDFVGVDSAKTELTWTSVEGGFPKLLSLEMIHLNLVHWKTQATHFPSLKNLNVQYCYAMVEIPLDMGNIQTLELIQVNKGSPLALVSARKIKEDQEGRGNKLLQLRTYTYVF